MVGLVGDFLDRLDLREVTLVGNDSGGAQLLVTQRRDERVGRLVLVACEAFDNYPPGIPGRLAQLSAKSAVTTYLMAQSLRLRPMRRAPMSWGWMSERPVPPQIMDEWFHPLTTNSAIRRDFRKYPARVPDKATLLEWAERQRAFDRPVLVVWATEDRLMPREHGQRLTELFPNARLVELSDSYTLIPEDQPGQLSGTIRQFLAVTGNSR
ncbi:MAG TPA: alpha/beta hydrolase [Jiangellaceae bacterium]|nr:alpha/beta hydrolase [Jiangellaceae bacterium]